MEMALLSKGKSSSGTSSIKGGKVLWTAAIVMAILVAGSMFALLSSVASTSTYYVLNQNVPARTQITPSMMTAVVTSDGGQPRNAATLADVQTGKVFSKYALNTGDVVSMSNSGPLTAINVGVPDTYVITSFSVEAKNAVAGRVKRGDYIDVIAVTTSTNGDERSKYILRNVLVLDVNSDLAQVGATTASTATANSAAGTSTGATASDSAAARGGVPSLYTVGLPPVDAARLALAVNDTLFIVLSPVQDSKGGVTPADISVNQSDLFGDSAVGNAGLGTDPTFQQDGTKTTGGTTQETTKPSASPAPTTTKPATTAPATTAPATTGGATLVAPTTAAKP
jgi:hypothetical protein